jgi:uncharacterized protein (DUF488 family)
MYDNLIPVELPDNYRTLTNSLMQPEMQNCIANKTQKQIQDNVKVDILNIPFKNPLQNTEELLKEQLHQSELVNKELKEQLDKAYIQLRQLNDKNSSQVLELKELKADLREESLKNELAETKLSIKDWKGWIYGAILGALITEIFEIIKTIIISSI